MPMESGYAEKNIIASLSEMDEKYFSHPGYPIKKHLANAAASFDEKSHKEAAIFHDTGKLTDEFQKYIKNNCKGQGTTHSLESALIYLAYKKYMISPESFAVFYSIIKHHGNLEDTHDFLYDKLSFEDDLLDSHPDIEQKLEKICQRLKIPLNIDLDKICCLFDTYENFARKYDLASIDNYFLIKEIFSKLIFCDKYEAIFKKAYHENISYHWKKYISKLVELIELKKNKMAFIRNQARNEIIDKYSGQKNKNIYIIEAPTGIGKTFSALHLALKICNDKNKKRIITALPMTSIIDQTHEEYKLIFEENILLKFHHLTHSKDYSSKNNEKKNEKSLNRQNDFIAMSWSEDRVIITTFNQILNIFYSNKNKDLIKFWTIRDSVIIMDEIQAIPRILIRDIAETISYLSKKLNIDFILMSATIPEIKQFIQGDMIAELLDNKYFSMDFNNRYSISVNPEIKDVESMIHAIITNYRTCNSLLCVVNSKKLSLELYQTLKNEFSHNITSSELFFLNTNFIPRQRTEIIDKIKKRLLNLQKTLLVSTQVVEAGVDLDFDFGIREFAPLCSMIQAAGRVNRENRDNLTNNAKLLITNKIGYCPYHSTDLLKDEVMELLSSDMSENRVLPVLKKYFNMAIERTSPDLLLYDHMRLLEFEKVHDIYSGHFMKEIPNIVPVFIEIEENLYEHFFSKIEQVCKIKDSAKSMEEKIEASSKLKKILKGISQYIINVSKDETDDLQDFHEMAAIKVCPYKFVRDGGKYSMESGWLGEKTLILTF